MEPKSCMFLLQHILACHSSGVCCSSHVLSDSLNSLKHRPLLLVAQFCRQRRLAYILSAISRDTAACSDTVPDPTRHAASREIELLRIIFTKTLTLCIVSESVSQANKMATRRSSRLQKQVAQEPVEIQQPAPVEVARSKKRKAPTAEPDATDKSKKKAPKLATGKGKDKSKEPPARPQIPSSNDALSSLPPEILHMILNHVSKQAQRIVSQLC